ncbi:MAG: VWA domain-containing protein [Blastocatellia bacterium]|nr:VWA domain-containing protein [Blastocatellia bacterium]
MSPFMYKFFLFHLLLLLAFSSTILAQDASSTASAARTRYLSEIGMMPASREVAVEEFVNYHRHEIGRPKAGEAVALDVRWGNDQAYGAGREAVLEVGFSTALAKDRQELRPLNLSLVIDKSGSMADSDKMSRVKAALFALVSHLRDDDLLTIVVFDSEAQVLLPARRAIDRVYIKQIIQRITPGGATNLHAGLMLGYEEARRYYRRDATNRVILLTDGIANRGETSPERIAADSLRFNDEGIDLATIGVGLDLDKDLLRKLAESGRGLFHFVADAGDIEKVFINELQSLISPVALEPKLDIDYEPDLELTQLYGYHPEFRRNGVTLKLENMNQGMTQVVLLRFRLAERSQLPTRLPVRVRFSYYDLEQKKQISKTQESSLTVRHGPPADLLKDPEVAKNYTIALLAQAIHDMAEACEMRRFQEAEHLLTAAIDQTYIRYPYLDDPDIRRTLSIAQNYQNNLKKFNKGSDTWSDR